LLSTYTSTMFAIDRAIDVLINIFISSFITRAEYSQLRVRIG